MKFKAGDKVWALCSLDEFKIYGRKAAVVVDLTNPGLEIRLRYPATVQWYAIELEDILTPANCHWISREELLSPRDEDGRQVGTWEHSITTWRPKKIDTVRAGTC